MHIIQTPVNLCINHSIAHEHNFTTSITELTPTCTMGVSGSQGELGKEKKWYLKHITKIN